MSLTEPFLNFKLLSLGGQKQEEFGSTSRLTASARQYPCHLLTQTSFPSLVSVLSLSGFLDAILFEALCCLGPPMTEVLEIWVSERKGRTRISSQGLVVEGPFEVLVPSSSVE